MHVHALGSDADASRVRVEGAGESVELTLGSTHALSGGLSPWLPLVLPAAMHLGLQLHLHGAVDRELLAGQIRAQRLLAGWYPDILREVPVRADEVTDPADRSDGVVLLFSGGVDAFHSALRHRGHVTHLLFVHGFDIPLWRTRLRCEVSQRLARVAGELGVELIEATVDTKPWMDGFVRWGEIYHGAATAGVALAHGGHAAEALIASSEAAEDVTPWGSHPDLDPLWSSGSMTLVHDSIEFDRAAKVRDIGSWDLAMRHLRVCWENPDEIYNCGTCEKCVRTMVNLHIAGCLDRCETLPRALDLARVRRPALNEEERLSIRHNLRALQERGVPDPQLERALRTALRRGSLRLPVERYLAGPARQHVLRPLRRALVGARP